MEHKITLDDLIECVRREIAFRKRVYKRMVAFENMDPQAAEREIFLMNAVLENLESQKQPNLF
jgi:hypothetical protein